MLVEYIGRRHGNHVHRYPLFRQFRLRFQCQCYFRAGSNNHRLRFAFRRAQYISTASDIGQLLFAAFHKRQVLAAENQARGMVCRFCRFRPSHQGFGGVARAPYCHVWNQAQRSGLLDRLVGGAVFTQTDGIVGIDKNRVDFHQRGHAQRVAGVFGEHQEGCAKRFYTAMQRQAVHDGRHTEFAHAVVQVVTAIVTGNRYAGRPVGKVGGR